MAMRLCETCNKPTARPVWQRADGSIDWARYWKEMPPSLAARFERMAAAARREAGPDPAQPLAEVLSRRDVATVDEGDLSHAGEVPAAPSLASTLGKTGRTPKEKR